jgi:vacuolar iron transporter family protein
MGFTKRLDEARKAFGSKDLQAAKSAHDLAKIKRAAEHHGGTGSQYLGEMVYGGLDGIVTTFAVVSGVAGAQLGAHIILIMGAANLFADGFSMAIGSYLSTRSVQEYYQREKERESWEVDHFPDGERAELVEMYRNQGYSDEDALTLVTIKSKDRERWIRSMMVEELEMLEDTSNPFYNALATLMAFIVAGAVPLLVYVLGLFTPIPPAAGFPTSLILSGFALFALGAAKVLVTQHNPWRSGLEMMLVGGLAAAVAFFVGMLLKGIGI